LRMVKSIDGDWELDKDFISEEDIIVTGDIKTKNKHSFRLGSDGIIKANMIFNVRLSGYHIQAYGLHVDDIYAPGVDAVKVYTGGVNIRGSISADILDADKISARLVMAREIRANDIMADYIICQRRIKKETTAKTSAKAFITDISRLQKRNWD
jgi:hypothetical protein